MFKKLTCEEIDEYFKSLNFKLLSKYHNYLDKLIFTDDEGYYYYNSYPQMKVIKNPEKFHKLNLYTIQNIKLWCKLNNKPFELLSDKYEDSNKKLKWKCLTEDCGEIFEMNWTVIHANQGCPYCAGRKLGVSNCLATKNPELAKEWHPTKNGDLTPYDVTRSSIKEVWWQCIKNSNHIWIAKINNRHNNTGCPYCNNKLPCEENNLLSLYTKICEEWNYEKNKKNPEEYLPYSHEKVWWKCKECGYEWKAKIQSRTNYLKNGCPECNKSKGEKRISEILNNNDILFEIQKIYDELLGVKKRNLSYDFYLPDYNLLIEYQGEFHDGTVKYQTRKQYEKQQEHDKRKKQYAIDNNIKLLEIWYWDFDNIEEILHTELNIKEIK